MLPVPVRPHYLDKRLVTTLKLVLDNTQRVSTKDIYNVLLKNEFSINEEFKLRIEAVYDDFSLKHLGVYAFKIHSNKCQVSHVENYPQN